MKVFKIILLALLFVSLPTQAADNLIKLNKEQIDNLGVQIGSLKAAANIPLLYAPAKVVIPPSHEYIVSAPQAGIVTKLTLSVGDNVKKNQLLGQMKSPELLSLQQAYLHALSERSLAASNQARDKKLLDEGIIAKKRWQETSNLYQVADLAVNEAKQMLEISGMSKTGLEKLANTRRLNSELTIFAPMNGVILERAVTVGQRLELLAPVYKIANLDELWLEINLPQEQVQNVTIGDVVQISNTDISAKITLLGKSVNPENQSLTARAMINGKQPQLKAGQSVNTQIIHADHHAATFEVPNSAIAQQEGQSYVFVRSNDGFKAVNINVIGKQGDFSVVTGNLIGTEQIAVQGAVALKANWIGLGSEE